LAIVSNQLKHLHRASELNKFRLTKQQQIGVDTNYRDRQSKRKIETHFIDAYFFIFD
jgi:hypothetical protein